MPMGFTKKESLSKNSRAKILNMRRQQLPKELSRQVAKSVFHYKLKGSHCPRHQKRSVWTLKTSILFAQWFAQDRDRAICKKGSQFCDSNLKNWRKIGTSPSWHSPDIIWGGQKHPGPLFSGGAEKGLGTSCPQGIRACSFWKVFWTFLSKVD